MINNKVKNIELPENLFSNLGEIKKKKSINTNNDIDQENEIRLTNYNKHKEYRNRINKMYDNIENLTPIDSEIDNVLYFNNYIEKGIVVKPKVSSLKQFWTEYRLITNEKKSPNYKFISDKIKSEEKEDTQLERIIPEETDINQKLNNFDSLFEALSKRVQEINEYIDELKEIRINIDESNSKLEEDKEKFTEEKNEFLNYKKQEEEKITKEKENLKINYDRLQTIIDDLDKKLNEIDK